MARVNSSIKTGTPETLAHHPHSTTTAVFELVRPFDHRMRP